MKPCTKTYFKLHHWYLFTFEHGEKEVYKIIEKEKDNPIFLDKHIYSAITIFKEKKDIMPINEVGQKRFNQCFELDNHDLIELKAELL